MATSAPSDVPQTEDPVSNVLKWILLVVAIGSFGLFAWATVLTYERAPPQPERFVTSGGATLMTAGRRLRRHRRLSESRPDGLRQLVRDGLLFRPGLHRLRTDQPGHAYRERPRADWLRQGI